MTATSGVSAVIDTDGSVRQRAEIFTAKTFVEPVVLSDHTTIATRAGEWPELIASVLAVLAVVIALWWGRRGARTPTRVGPAGLDQPRGGQPAKDRVTP